MAKLVFGVGINDGKYPAKINGKNTKEYTLWMDILKRCYSEKYHLRRPTYVFCEISDNFKYYSYFYEWCQEQIGFKDGFHLDKDLLVKGNKVYSENTCVFIPCELNSLLVKVNVKRGKYPIGVYWDKTRNKFKAQVNLNVGKQKNLGYFNTETEAFNAYKTAKENYLKELAEKWKDKIDLRAYEALMNYQVEITD